MAVSALMNKIFVSILILIYVSGCASFKRNGIYVDEEISKDIVSKIISAWESKKSGKLDSISKLGAEQCPSLNTEYRSFELCANVYLVATKYKENIGYSAYHAYELCTKLECQIMIGETNYGIEE